MSANKKENFLNKPKIQLLTQGAGLQAQFTAQTGVVPS